MVGDAGALRRQRREQRDLRAGASTVMRCPRATWSPPPSPVSAAITRSQLKSATASWPRRPSSAARSPIVPEQVEARRERRRVAGWMDAPVLVVAHQLEDGAGIGRGEDRLGGLERLDGDEAEVLVVRRVVDRQAVAIERDQLLVGDASDQLDAALEPVPADELDQAVAQRAVAGDLASHRRGGEAEALDQELDALELLEAAGGEHVVARRPRLEAIEQSRRRVEHRGLRRRCGGARARRRWRRWRRAPATRRTRDRPSRAPARPGGGRAGRGRSRSTTCPAGRRPGGTGAPARPPCWSDAPGRRGTWWR